MQDINAGRYHEERLCDKEFPTCNDRSHDFEFSEKDSRSVCPVATSSFQRSHVQCYDCGALQPKQANTCGVCEVNLWQVAKPGRPSLPRAGTGKPPGAMELPESKVST